MHARFFTPVAKSAPTACHSSPPFPYLLPFAFLLHLSPTLVKCPYPSPLVDAVVAVQEVDQRWAASGSERGGSYGGSPPEPAGAANPFQVCLVSRPASIAVGTSTVEPRLWTHHRYMVFRQR